MWPLESAFWSAREGQRSGLGRGVRVGVGLDGRLPLGGLVIADRADAAVGDAGDVLGLARLGLDEVVLGDGARGGVDDAEDRLAVNLDLDAGRDLDGRGLVEVV